jgi:hypothetical protein
MKKRPDQYLWQHKILIKFKNNSDLLQDKTQPLFLIQLQPILTIILTAKITYFDNYLLIYKISLKLTMMKKTKIRFFKN